MRYIGLILVAAGALCFPFGLKNLLQALSAGTSVRNSLLTLLVGSILIIVGTLIAKRDEITSVWRNRSRPSRIRLR